MSSSTRLTFTMKPTSRLLKERNLQDGGKVQRFVDSEVLRRCEPLAPKDTGELIRSGTKQTKIGSGLVIYKTPYARRWYYEPAKFEGAPQRGGYWFERMKNQGGKEAILKGAANIAGAEASK